MKKEQWSRLIRRRKGLGWKHETGCCTSQTLTGIQNTGLDKLMEDPQLTKSDFDIASGSESF